MLNSLRQRKVARVLFDESHGEAWSIRPEIAAAIQPEHPAGSSYAAAAAALAERDYEVAALTAGPLSAAALAAADVLVIAHPSEARWERTVGGSPRPVGRRDRRDRVVRRRRRRPRRARRDRRGQVRRQPQRASRAVRPRRRQPHGRGLHAPQRHADVGLRRARSPDGRGGPAAPACARSASTAPAHSRAEREGALVLRAGDQAHPARAGLLAAVRHGEGRVVVAADSDLFGDDALGRVRPPAAVAQPALLGRPAGLSRRARDDRVGRGRTTSPGSACATRPTRCVCCRSPRARSISPRHAAAEVRAHVAAMIDAHRRARAATFPTSRPIWPRWSADLRAWVDDGCGKPDFAASLALFRPEQVRSDGIEHLVVFPMYTPNGSPDTRFEALIVRTPWPEFVARLERERLRQRQVRAGAARRPHGRLRRRVRRAVPRDGERRRRARPTTSAASSAIARRRASSARPQRAARRCCASSCRPTPRPWWPTATSRARPTSSGT